MALFQLRVCERHRFRWALQHGRCNIDIATSTLETNQRCGIGVATWLGLALLGGLYWAGFTGLTLLGLA
jgi:hypothetical protein